MDKSVQDKLDKFFSQFKYQIYNKGEILIRADDDPPGVFYLKDGIVKMYAISKKGENVIVNLYKPISFFPVSWAINNSPNRYFYEAMTQVEVCKAPKDKVIEFMREENDILFDLVSRVYWGIEGLLMRMVYLMSGSAYTRLITELLICAKRFGIKERNTGIVTCAVAEKDLAAQTGMTFETISREITILKKRGLIKFQRGTLVIPDIVRLESELSGDFNALS